MAKPKETDLYPPLKTFLEGQGYEVKGEVLDCDILAVRGSEEPVIVELKLTLNLMLVMQAVERLALSEKVYIAVPEGNATVKKQRKRLLKTLRMLGVGLLTVEVEKSRVGVLLDPGPYQPRKKKKLQERLLGEFHRRVGDPNLGGAAKRRGLMTAYRQRALAIARYLSAQGPSKASTVAKALDEPKARQVLYTNVYGWFDRVAVGIYALSPKGEAGLEEWSG